LRILALDWGTVRVGAAISDETGTIATPFEKVLETKTAAAELKEIIKQYDIGHIVIGLPKTLEGKTGTSAQAVKEFGERLGNETQIPITYLDERLSSVGAAKTLSQMGISQKNQRGLVDNMAAQQVLQSYLDTKNN
jgi:putative Holliday junction resolvase